MTGKITKRANDIKHFEKLDVISLQMDIVATHISGCPLRLKALLEAPISDFIHDIYGILKHLDRTTGKLQDCFVPRYTAEKLVNEYADAENNAKG